MAACAVAPDNRRVDIDSHEDAMTWKRNRSTVNDGPWISAQQAFIATCWAALFAACVLDQLVRPLFS
ncbi:MAG TPA: hypothetical protein VG840_13305 [Casimicrobiaceae bacterium]|nr:hypothetical protein [Casimicrobiaceae bacterium]